MESFKKMMLVDQRMLQNMQQLQNTQQLPQPNVTQMQTLDQEMSTILQRHDLSERDKMTLYNQALNRYMTYRSKFYTDQIPIQVKLESAKLSPLVMNKTDTNTSEGPDIIEREILLSVPKSMHTKAQLLLSKIRNDSDMSWTSKGELVYKDRVVENSNMSDLMNDILRRRQNNNPKGWQIFAQGLKQLNVPNEFVGNPERWSYMHSPESVSHTPLHTPPQYNTSGKRSPASRLPVRRASGNTAVKKIKWTPY